MWFRQGRWRELRDIPPPGGIDDYDDNNDDGEGSSSLAIVMIVTFINQYTYNLYHYTTIDPPNLFWNNNHTIFACYGVSINIES